MSVESSVASYLRQKIGISPSKLSRVEMLQRLMCFWHHFSLHKRTSDYSGKPMVSVFSPTCVYPIWHREEWLAHAAPPHLIWNCARPFFEQLYELFIQCPIPHNTGLSNENCEYTDDWWNSKNCYLSHSGINCRDLVYCYRVLECVDSRYCAFCFYCELCNDCVNSVSCFNTTYAINARQCRDSAFLFDCRNCSDCFLCWNLRNKKYCIKNKQLSKEQYLAERSAYNLESYIVYQQLQKEFTAIVYEQAIVRALPMEKCEESLGAYIENTKRCDECYFISDAEDCYNVVRGGLGVKDCIHAVGVGQNSELLAHVSCVWENAREIKNCFWIVKSSRLEYCGFCHGCEDCFACCGLVNKKFCIFNKEYSPDEYHRLMQEIKQAMESEGMQGEFFPEHFAPAPYEESMAGYFFPRQKVNASNVITIGEYAPLSVIPDITSNADTSITTHRWWDTVENRPFQITQQDLLFAQRNHLPLPHESYLCRIKELYRWMWWNGGLREGISPSGHKVLTVAPQQFDGRILSEQEYLNLM